MAGALRSYYREFGEHLEIIAVNSAKGAVPRRHTAKEHSTGAARTRPVLRVFPRSVDSLDPVGLHGCDNLQIKHFSTHDRVTTKQVQPPFHRAGWNGQHVKKSKQTGNGV
jgi:hypothetical protein